MIPDRASVPQHCLQDSAADGGHLHVTLQGGFGAILEWTGTGDRKEMTDTPGSGMSVSMVAGEGLEPPTHGL